MIISKLIAQFDTSDIDNVTNELAPLSPTIATGQNPLIDILWGVVSSLFTLAVYGFLLAMLVGGVWYLISLGNDDQISKAKKTFINATIGLLIVFGSYQLINFFVGQFGPSIITGSVVGLIAKIYDITLILGAAVFILVLLFGGVRYLTAAGNDDSAEKAKKQIVSGVIGIVLIAFAFGIGRAILVLLNIPIQ